MFEAGGGAGAIKRRHHVVLRFRDGGAAYRHEKYGDAISRDHLLAVGGLGSCFAHLEFVVCDVRWSRVWLMWFRSVDDAV